MNSQCLCQSVGLNPGHILETTVMDQSAKVIIFYVVSPRFSTLCVWQLYSLLILVNFTDPY